MANSTSYLYLRVISILKNNFLGIFISAIPSSIRFGYILEKGINSLFYCWVREVTPQGERFRLEDPTKYWIISWNETEYTQFKQAKYIKPKGLVTVSLRSRAVFKYGVFQLYAKLPKWKDGPMLWFGFETEDLFGGGVIHFMLHNDKLYAFSGTWGIKVLRMTLPGLPEDYHLERHTYTIYVHKTVALWFIDECLRGIAILASGGKPIVVHEGYPYSLGITPLKPSTTLGVLLDIDGGPTDREWIWEDLHPWQVRVLEGDPTPSLLLKLHRLGTNELFQGKVEEKELISHPIPALGVKTTLLFKADKAGRLAIQTYTLNETWEELDNLKVQEDKLVSYTIEEDVPLLRISYEPQTIPATVNISEVYIC